MTKLVVIVVFASWMTAGVAHGVEVVGAGDIALAGGSGDTKTSDLVLALDPAMVLTFGDHAYNDGSPSQFSNYYDPTWGRFKNITEPSPGNHDWHTAGAADTRVTSVFRPADPFSSSSGTGSWSRWTR